MHKSGVILAWLVALTAVGAVLLTSKMLDVRGSWLKAVEKNKAQIEKNEAEIAAKEKEDKELRGELTRLMLGWDRYWDAKVTVNNPQTGEIQAMVGGNVGFGPIQQGDNPAVQPVVFAFQPDPNKPNGVAYVGAFRVISAQANNSQLVPVTPPEQGEVATWGNNNNNNTWRLRAMVPPNFVSTLRTLRDNLIERNQQLARNEDRVEDLKELLTAAQGRLQVRIAELTGSENLPQDELLPVEARKGLVAGLEEEEQLRNEEFQETDRLRRDLLNVYRKQLELVQDVSKLTKQLPQQVPADY